MNDVREISRRRAPFPRPQSIAFQGPSLWIGSVETGKIYRLDPRSLEVLEEAAAPGKPWGMVAANGELRVISGETDEDNRFINRFVPGKGFLTEGRMSCPDATGSQLGFDGERLYVSQWYNRRILHVDEAGVHEVIDVPHQICGQTIANGDFYLVTTDDESSTNYWLTRIRTRNGERTIEDVARIPFAARALAFDGHHFWTNHRDQHEIVEFEV